MRYLITGATGFIAPHLIRELTSAGHRCRCLVRNIRKADMLKEYSAEIIEGDITDAASLNGIADRMDRVLHLATLGHMSNFAVPEAMFDQVNGVGTVNVMNEALKAKVPKVVHCSSVAAMGICSEARIPADETTECRPHHAYGRSKLKAEQAVLKMVADQGLPAVIIRFSMVYGPGDWRDMLKITRMAKKGLFPKIGRRAKLTPLIHVSDAVQGLLLAADKGRIGEIYLITNAKSEPFDRIGDIIRNALGMSIPALYIPEWAALMLASTAEKLFPLIGKIPPVTRKNIESTIADRMFSIEKARNGLGFAPRIDPETGIRETVEWYVKNGWV